MDELGEIVEDCDHDNSCGMHVHVDASDYSQWDLRKLIMLWAGVESTMYELIARQRWENTSCMVSSRRYVRALLSDDTIEVAGDEEEEGQQKEHGHGAPVAPQLAELLEDDGPHERLRGRPGAATMNSTSDEFYAR